MAEQRKRLKRIECPGHGRYLTFSCYRRLPLFQNDAIKDAFVAQLARARHETRIHLLAWVIMPEHVHLLVRTLNDGITIPRWLMRLKRPFATHVIGRWRELAAPVLDHVIDSRGQAHFWQMGGGYDRNIVGGHELFEKIDYIHQNPLRRGLVSDVRDWAWSSARWYAGERAGVLPIDAVDLA